MDSGGVETGCDCLRDFVVLDGGDDFYVGEQPDVQGSVCAKHSSMKTPRFTDFDCFFWLNCLHLHP